MYHYVYIIEHIETNQFYIGSRSSKVHPSLDPYLGSMSVWKPDKSKIKKTILKDDFLNRSEAFEFEISLIEENINKPLNENYHIPNRGFSSHGMTIGKTNSGDLVFVKKDDSRFETGELIHFKKGSKNSIETINKIRKTIESKGGYKGEKNSFFGKKHSPESIEKMRSSALNKNITPESEIQRRAKISKFMKYRNETNPTEWFYEKIRTEYLGENNPYYKFLKETGATHHSKGKKYERVICTKCKKNIAINKSYNHFDNCKFFEQ